MKQWNILSCERLSFRQCRFVNFVIFSFCQFRYYFFLSKNIVNVSESTVFRHFVNHSELGSVVSKYAPIIAFDPPTASNDYSGSSTYCDVTSTQGPTTTFFRLHVIKMG